MEHEELYRAVRRSDGVQIGWDMFLTRSKVEMMARLNPTLAFWCEDSGEVIYAQAG